MRSIHILNHGRNNNFNLIRVIAAGSVLISHAFPIVLGPAATEPLADIAPTNLGRLAVAVFFAISGFFIAKSFDRRGSLAEFCVARFLRIYPALTAVLLLTVVGIGPLFTHLPLSDYFSERATWTYLPHNLSLFRLQWTLPGVFSANPGNAAINGSLWTLWYEVSCYAMVVIVGLVGLLKPQRFLLFCLFYAAVYAGGRFHAGQGELPFWLELSFPFVIGMAFYTFARRIPLNIFVLSALALAAFLLRDKIVYREVFILALSYATFWAGAISWRPLRAYNKLGDYSYGLYIFAFPIEQMIVAASPGIRPLGLMLVALVLAIGCAILSWHWIESPALSHRKPLGRWLETYLLRLFRSNRSTERSRL